MDVFSDLLWWREELFIYGQLFTKGETYGDGYYSNWIIKISPATLAPDPTPDPVPPYKVTRVMCEDLGNSHDFDFNDVVFDVKLETDNGHAGK